MEQVVPPCKIYVSTLPMENSKAPITLCQVEGICGGLDRGLLGRNETGREIMGGLAWFMVTLCTTLGSGGERIAYATKVLSGGTT